LVHSSKAIKKTLESREIPENWQIPERKNKLVQENVVANLTPKGMSERTIMRGNAEG